MSVSPNVQAIICEEIFDDSSHPSLEEINEYATKIGIDPNEEPHLLHLAKEGLMQALPPDWKPCYDEKSKSYYYFNSQQGKTQWEHPLDDVYRSLVVKVRSNSQASFEEDSKGHEDQTYTKEDLHSIEETPKPILPKSQTSPIRKLQPVEVQNKLKNFNLSPIKTKSKSMQDFRKNVEAMSSLSKKRGSRSNTLDDLDFSVEKVNENRSLPKDDKHPNSIEKGELTLSGGGSMFLKSNTKKISEIDTSKSLDQESAPKSILRDRSLPEPPMPLLREPSEDKRKQDSEDDRKFVRFNLEARPDIDFTFSDSDQKSTSDEDIENIAKLILKPELKKTSRFTVSPVKFDEYALLKKDDPHKSILDIQITPKEEKSRNSNLKLIKPNVTDFITPKLIAKPIDVIKPTFLLSDSEEESIAKYKAKFPKEDSILTEKLISLQDSIPEENSDKIIEINSDNKKPEIDDENKSLDNIDSEKEKLKMELDETLKKYKDELTEKNNLEIKNHENELLENKQKQIEKFIKEINDSQNKEYAELLANEKIKQEELIKNEIEKLKVDLDNSHRKALKDSEEKFKAQLEEKKADLEKQFNQHIEELEKSFQEKEMEISNNFQISLQQTEKEFVLKLEERVKEISVAHKAVLDRMKDDHNFTLEELVRDFKSEEEIIRKEHLQNLSELKDKLAHELELERQKMRDLGEDRLYEKVRCEKRLLEDKYQCLKEKYLRLKKDVKISLEKRNRRREQNLTTTGSETERSSSQKKPGNSESPKNLEKPPTTPKHLSKLTKPDMNSNRTKADSKTVHQITIEDLDTSMSERSGKINDKQIELDSSDGFSNIGRSRKKMFTRLKSSSTSRLNNNSSKVREFKRSCSPVENLRRQLQKLEDLEDQFPQNAQADTYHLRYPFSDAGEVGGSSELEFFRHRIHLERDSVRRAKESLRTQKTNFQKRQRELKLRHGNAARNTIHQLYNEERELSDMEVSLHRTRSLLGEKVIRLRHLEQSLQRLSVSTKQEDATLSDLSSHSASSGISSTEFATATDNNLGLNGRVVHFEKEQLQESSEIMQSLENLNCEIREIWDVLNKQQHTTNVTSVMPSLVYSDHVWPLATSNMAVPAVPTLNVIPTLADRLHDYHQRTALASHGVQSIVVTHPPRAAQGAAVTTTLVERTKNLRDWLRQAKVEQGENSAPGQTTL